MVVTARASVVHGSFICIYPNLICGSLAMATRSIQPFLRNSRLRPANTQTEHVTYRHLQQQSAYLQVNNNTLINL